MAREWLLLPVNCPMDWKPTPGTKPILYFLPLNSVSCPNNKFAAKKVFKQANSRNAFLDNAVYNYEVALSLQ